MRIDALLANVEKELLEAAKAHYRSWRAEHAEEILYGYGFFTPPCVEWACAVAFSEAGLQQVVDDYRSKPRYAAESVQALTWSLRWSPADSPYCGSYPEAFEQANTTLSEISENTHALDANDSRFGTHVDSLYLALIGALQQFRKEAFAGSERPLLSVWFGDQSPAEIEFFVRSCNSAPVCNWFFDSIEEK